MGESDRLVRVGAVDCGTNSIRLLVADVDRTTGALTDVLRRMEIVRLGYGVDRTGRIDPVAMERTLAMSREYADQCASLGAESVRFAATSASRDASNGNDAGSKFGTPMSSDTLPSACSSPVTRPPGLCSRTVLSPSLRATRAAMQRAPLAHCSTSEPSELKMR